jgi:hypothetical protein
LDEQSLVLSGVFVSELGEAAGWVELLSLMFIEVRVYELMPGT